jgi:hypothetical protein
VELAQTGPRRRCCAGFSPRFSLFLTRFPALTCTLLRRVQLENYSCQRRTTETACSTENTGDRCRATINVGCVTHSVRYCRAWAFA